MYSKDWHVHTAMSSCCHEADWQGRAVVDRALEVGLTAIGITDHLFPGLEIEQVIAGAREIKTASKGSGLTVYLPLEMETFDDTGRISATTEDLSGLDYVMAAAGHFHLPWVRKPGATISSVVDYHHRLHLALCGNSMVDVIAHPWFGLHPSVAETLGIDGITADDVPENQVMELCQAAADSRTALELNCSQNDLELFQNLHQRLIETGARFGTSFAVGSDAHASDTLDRISRNWPQLADWGLTEEMLWEPGEKR